MFELEKAIAEWRQEMLLAGIKNSEVLDELESHLREQTARLAKTGISESAAFQTAVRELGESQALRREFSKISRPLLWIRRDNPVALNLLAAWFTIDALNRVFCWLSLLHLVLPHGNHAGFNSHPSTSYVGALYSAVLTGILFFTGVGLYRRQNFWRICAFIWPILIVAGTIYRFTSSPSDYLASTYHLWITGYGDNARYLFMGLFVSPVVLYIKLIITLPIFSWGCYFLTRPVIRNLFRPDSKVETA